ncbi:hypothetical protein ASD16_07650 [Cellulomonas sp. Root485]|uniref:hypothetical protein n=1 Tax=Cellulomonas sp. Root485 TaxID=1736546 RepID=UPI0006F23405|nr:hypothetical protein [Cellulomonas sp. Root485]KQY25289.1 hypothetical protein ASD16_07650 [Cellulomonas sp. Root485]
MLATRRAVVAVGLWLTGLVLLWAVGRVLADRGAVVTYGSAPPFIGYLHGRASVGTVLAVVVAGVVVLSGPRFARTARWRLVLLAGWGASTLFAVLLAATDGLSAIAAPLTDENDYLAVVPAVAQDPGEFLRSFTDQALTYPVHVRGHPPGVPLLLGGLDRLGLGGAGWMAALVVVVGTSSVVAVGVTVRALAGTRGEETVRRALPAVVLAPAALWLATSADALFSGVLAWGVALLAIASTREGRSWPWAIAAGLVLGLCPFLSYGLLPMGALALVVGIVTRRWAPTVVAGVVVLACAAAWGAAGFWLPDGIAVTHLASTLGRAADRPYLYFLVADLVLLGTLVGPAGVGGLVGLRHLPRAVRLLVVVALGAALLGALSGVERGEVERIWLPLACWVLPVAATLADRRGWLVAQASATIALQVVLVSPW